MAIMFLFKNLNIVKADRMVVLVTFSTGTRPKQVRYSFLEMAIQMQQQIIKLCY